MSTPGEIAPWGSPDVSQDERTMALLAHLSVFFGALIVPAILMVAKSDSTFVRYHATQALVYQAITVGIVVVIAVCTFGMGAFVAFLPWIGGILLALKANQGEWVGYPMIENIGK